MPALSNRIMQFVAIAVIVVVVGRAVYHRFGTTSSEAAVVDQNVSTPTAADHNDNQSTADVENSSDDLPTATLGNDDPIGALFGIGFDVAHKATQMGNNALDHLAGLSVAEEIQIGRDAWQETISHHKVLKKPQQQSRIERLAAPYLAERDRKDIDYRFTILDDDTVNAFAHLGGYVYVNRGLLDAVHDDEELAFVIGHEIAHVDRRHCVKNMTVVVRAQQAAGGLGGTMASLAYKAISVGYSEDFELDADQWSYHVMRKLGHTHEESLRGLKMLEREFGADGDHHAHGPVIIKHVEDHFRTHPRIADRLAQLERLK